MSDQVSAALLDSELIFKKAEQILIRHIPSLRLRVPQMWQVRG